MTTTNEEYIDKKESPFGLVRKEDPNQLLAIRLREQACDDPKLSDGACRLFVRLLDLALNPFWHQGWKGRIRISQATLGSYIQCDERSIRRRTTELVEKNYVWTCLIGRQNTKPITEYHITEFIPRRNVQEVVPGEGLLARGRRIRNDHGFEKTGRDATGQMRRVGGNLVDRFGHQIFLNYLENTPVSGQKSPLSADNSDRSGRTVASSVRGQFRPVTEDSSVLSHRTPASADSGQNCPLTEDAGVRQLESQIGDRGLKSTSKTISKGKRPLSQEERRFLEEMSFGTVKVVGKTRGEAEIMKFGKQWLARYREDAEKQERILADAKTALREGTITDSFGAYCNTLWNQFSSRKAVGA